MKAIVAISLGLLLVAGCREEPMEGRAADAGNHTKEIADWQKDRATRLKSEYGWLSLTGLFWLDEGANTVTLPSAGSPNVQVTRQGEVATLAPTPAATIDGKPVTAPVVLKNDADPAGPTTVQIGTVRFQIIKRGERLGLRARDSQAPTRTQFAGLEYYPTNAKYRVEARYEPYKPEKKIPITDVTGMTADSIAPGALVFTLEGKEYRIDPVNEEGTDDLFIIFKDATSRDETYQAGRYLYAKRPGADGKTVVDFNKAYNPPCAFTHFATCPLPPPQNRLPIRIEAGEKRYAHGH